MEEDKFYLYSMNYAPDEMEFALMEMRYIFGVNISDKIFCSSKEVDPSSSPFIRESIEVILRCSGFDELIQGIKNLELKCEDFKVNYFKTLSSVEYSRRLSLIKEVGMAIEGEANLYKPKIEFAIAYYMDSWFFGTYHPHNNQWHIHDKKPCTYSNSINYKVARSLVNIATCGDYSKSLIDPCCGIGTVLLEAASLLVDYTGCEINPMIGERARVNLEFFGYEPNVVIGDMTNLQGFYDCSVIDLPYGHFNPISEEDQISIIKGARKLTKRLVLITNQNMDTIIFSAGFNVESSCILSKGKFKRYVTVCI
ncbi:MAG: SAM-dependent methyltransferase [Clostridium sp.]